MDATEIVQYVPSDMDSQSPSYNTYKRRHTVKVATCVSPNGALVFSSDISVINFRCNHRWSLWCVATAKGMKSNNGWYEFKRLWQTSSCCVTDYFTFSVAQSTLHKGVGSNMLQDWWLNISPFLLRNTLHKGVGSIMLKVRKVKRANERITNYEIWDHILAQYRHISTYNYHFIP